MSKTLLNGINDLLARLKIIDSANALASITSTSHQNDVDLGIQLWNEAIDELYSLSSVPLPKSQAEGTITLATGTRAYDLAADLVQIRWPLIDKTNSQFIFRYPGDYNDLLIYDPEQDDTGLPHYGVIRPTDGKLFVDVAPTAQENGLVYTYQYDKDTILSAAADTMPFNDAVYRAVLPVVAEAWQLIRNNEMHADFFKLSLGRAGRLLTSDQPRESWNPR